MANRKVNIKKTEMDEEMQLFAIDCAAHALQILDLEQEIAGFIKQKFDKKYNPTWHCIVGRDFGSYVTHQISCFTYFYVGQIAILLFKIG